MERILRTDLAEFGALGRCPKRVLRIPDYGVHVTDVRPRVRTRRHRLKRKPLAPEGTSCAPPRVLHSYAGMGCALRRYALSAQLVDADQVARGIAEGAVANPIRLRGRLLDDFGAAGLHPREGAVEVGGGQDDGGVAALGHHLDDGAALVVGDGARADGRRMQGDGRPGRAGGATRAPPLTAVSDLVADFKAEGVTIARHGCVRVVVREKGFA